MPECVAILFVQSEATNKASVEKPLPLLAAYMGMIVDGVQIVSAKQLQDNPHFTFRGPASLRTAGLRSL